jgi:hypothetical protein
MLKSRMPKASKKDPGSQSDVPYDCEGFGEFDGFADLSQLRCTTLLRRR